MKKPILGAAAIALSAAVLSTPAFAVVPTTSGRLAAPVTETVTVVRMTNDKMMMKHHGMHKHHMMHRHHTKRHMMMHKKPMMKQM